MINARIKIEVACTDCQGSGKELVIDQEVGPEPVECHCSGCDGEGYQELYVSIERLKWLLEGSDL